MTGPIYQIDVIRKDINDQSDIREQVPDGFCFVNLDLNRGAEGDFIFIIFSREPGNEGDKPISDLSVIHGDSSNIQPPNGYTKIDVDLNKNAGGKWIYLCYTRGTTDKPVHDVVVTSVDIDDRPTHPDVEGYDLIDYDLNAGAEGDFIFLHQMKKTVDEESELNYDLLTSGITPEMINSGDVERLHEISRVQTGKNELLIRYQMINKYYSYSFSPNTQITKTVTQSEGMLLSELDNFIAGTSISVSGGAETRHANFSAEINLLLGHTHSSEYTTTESSEKEIMIEYPSVSYSSELACFQGIEVLRTYRIDNINSKAEETVSGMSVFADYLKNEDGSYGKKDNRLVAK